MPKMRLDRFFSTQEILSRSEVRVAIRAGGVFINGRPAKSWDESVDTDSDNITLYRQEISYKPYIYIMLNKPKGVVSSTDDKINKTVLDLVPPELFRKSLFPAGRLDKDTEGFIILTNDGEFSHSILSPKKHIEKTYIATLDGELTAEHIAKIEAGMTLHSGEECKPAQVRVISSGAESVVEIILVEGKYHQVKRMFGELELGVNELKRVKIGRLSLDDTLALGECREILHKEIELILGK